MIQHRLSTILLVTLVLLSSLYLMHASNVLSRNIGLFHDELWDFNPAVSMINGVSNPQSPSIRLFRRPIPLVSGPYQGALKVWVAAPFLAVFGTSPGFLLAVNVLFSATFLMALYWALRPIVGDTWACLVFVLPFVDTNFLLIAPMDTGPSLFQYIFISLAMGALFRYVAFNHLKHYWMTWFFVGCLLAQKLTSIPVVIGFAATIAVLSCMRFLKAIRSDKTLRVLWSFIIVPGVVFVVPLIPHLIYFSTSGFADLFGMTAEKRPAPYFVALRANFIFFCSMFDGVDWYRRITWTAGPDQTGLSGLALCGGVIIACAILVYLGSNYDRKTGRFVWLSVLLGAGCFALAPCFSGLTRPWHNYIFTPIFWAGCVIATVYCLTFLADRFKKHATIPLILVVAGLFTGIVMNMRYQRGVLQQVENRKGTCYMSPVIYDVHEAIAKLKLRIVYAINYSLAVPIHVLSKGTVHLEDLTWTELTPQMIEELLAKIETQSNIGLLFRIYGDREMAPEWIASLNREPQINELLNKLKNKEDTLNIVRFVDNRQTEFILITGKRQP